MIKFRYKRKEPNNNVEKNGDKETNSENVKKVNAVRKNGQKTKELKVQTAKGNIREDYLECIRAVVVSFFTLLYYSQNVDIFYKLKI